MPRFISAIMTEGNAWRIATPVRSKYCLPPMEARHGLDDPLLRLWAARRGLGVAFLPCALGDADPALVRLPGSEPVPRFDIWILSHPDLRDTARLRAARDHLVAAIEAKADRFEGRAGSA